MSRACSSRRLARKVLANSSWACGSSRDHGAAALGIHEGIDLVVVELLSEEVEGLDEVAAVDDRLGQPVHDLPVALLEALASLQPLLELAVVDRCVPRVDRAQEALHEDVAVVVAAGLHGLRLASAGDRLRDDEVRDHTTVTIDVYHRSLVHCDLAFTCSPPGMSAV